jgi:DHA2 family multidrug resistance protein-like MFS transporter
MDSRQRWVLAACCTVAFAKLADPQAWMMGLDIPESAFGAAWADYRVFATINAILLMAFLLLGGVLGDALGRRRVLLAGAALATGSNVLAALAPNPPLFVIGRSLEAIGSALALPMTLAVLRLTFHGRALPVALLVYTFVTALGSLASLLALVLVEVAGWRATLVLPIIGGAVGFYLVWRAVPESRAGAGDRLRRGVAAAAWSLILFVLTIGLIALRQAWPNPITLVAAAISGVGAVVLAVSGRGKLRDASRPRLNWRLRHTFSVMLLAAAVLSLGLTGYLMQLYSFFTVVQGYGPILGGVALVPILLVCLPFARPAARMAADVESRRLIAGGLAFMGCALLVTALIRPGIPYWPLAIPMAVFGMGFLLAQTAWNNAFLSTLPEDVVGISAGISKAAAQTGTVLGTSLLGALMRQSGEADFTRRLSDVGLSSEQIAQATAILNTAMQADLSLGGSGAAISAPITLLEQGLLAAYYESYTVGLAVALVWAAVACLGVAVMVWVVLTRVRNARRLSGVADVRSDPGTAPG